MHYDIEFYKEGGKYCANIGQKDGNIHKISSDTIDGLSWEIDYYFGDVLEEKDFEIEQ